MTGISLLEWLSAPATPIELHDDGLRLIEIGDTHGYRFISLENPEHIANVIALKRHQEMLNNRNHRRS